MVCTVIANDGIDDGNTIEQTLLIDNTAPSVSGVNISCAANCLAGDTLTCNYTFVDVDQDSDQSDFSWSVNGQMVGSVTNTLTTGFDGGDTVECTVNPSDGIDTGASATGTLTIGNTPPSVSDVQISSSSGSFVTGDTLTCNYVFNDADGDPDQSSFVWRVNGGGTVGSTATLSSGFNGGDTVSCEVTPNDGKNNGVSETADVVINNTPPVVSGVTVLPDPAYANTSLLCDYTYSDADNEPDQSTVAWTINGVTAGSGPSLGNGFVFGDNVVCTVTPNDGNGPQAALSDDLTISNTLPAVSNVQLSSNSAASGDGNPLTAIVGDTLQCAYDFSDPDCTTGSCDESTYAWTVDGAPLSTTSSTLSAGFSGGESVACSVTAADGNATGNTGTASIVIGNSTPSVADVVISPNPASTSDDLTCSWTFNDADGDADASTVVWSVNGVFAASTPTLPAGTAVGGDVVRCEVTPRDGQVSGTPAVDQLVLENTAPTVSNVSIQSGTSQTGETLTCVYTYSDIDGDPDTSTTTWKVNGAVTATGTTFSGVFVSGDVVSCEVQAFDGTDTGNTDSDAFTVLNTIPQSRTSTSVQTQRRQPIA